MGEGRGAAVGVATGGSAAKEARRCRAQPPLPLSRRRSAPLYRRPRACPLATVAHHRPLHSACHALARCPSPRALCSTSPAVAAAASSAALAASAVADRPSPHRPRRARSASREREERGGEEEKSMAGGKSPFRCSEFRRLLTDKRTSIWAVNSQMDVQNSSRPYPVT
uniref:Uncharacterized protein n=1 Tax=Oryza sativa subsp. japonica TaxID=39947 RepID=Q60DP0_ORYSJ|nr:hypothetical protein [Oryza sativa Japonica Group]